MNSYSPLIPLQFSPIPFPLSPVEKWFGDSLRKGRQDGWSVAFRGGSGVAVEGRDPRVITSS
jgi:hypothetical protein